MKVSPARSAGEPASTRVMTGVTGMAASFKSRTNAGVASSDSAGGFHSVGGSNNAMVEVMANEQIPFLDFFNVAQVTTTINSSGKLICWERTRSRDSRREEVASWL